MLGAGVLAGAGHANTSASGSPVGQAPALATSAAAADDPTDTSSPGGRGQAPPKSETNDDHVLPDVEPDVADDALVKAVAEDLRISVDQAADRLARQPEQIERGRSLEAQLNGRSGGFYLDDNGDLVVTTVDAAGDKVVKKAGAKAKRVRHNSARLDAIAKKLARHVDKHGGGEVHGWHVDVPSNTVVVEVTEGADDPATSALLTVARRFGTSVRVEHVDAALRTASAAESVVGGAGYDTDSVYGSNYDCSIGFNARNLSGYPVAITAGHCVDGMENQWTMRSGYAFGRVRSESFPYNDYATIWNEYSYYFQPSAHVDMWNGWWTKVKGYWNSPPAGTIVCKSGINTGWSCGQITAHNAYASYKQGYVFGLVRHTACVQPGDSGGANIHPDGWALGITSGASMYDLNGDGYGDTCRSNVNWRETNVSYYQPIGEVLRDERLTLITTN